MEYATLNNGVKMPMAGIGTFLLTPDEAEASCVSALQDGYRLIMNCNRHGGQEVYHIHMHLVGGRPLGPMLAHKG